MDNIKKEKSAENITAKILNMESMVDYQDGSVVSRTIITKESGTVTLFAFGEGQGLSEHTAPFDALVYVLDGKAAVMIDGKKFEPSKGEMIIMPANKPHSLKAENKFKMLLVMVKK